MTRRAILVGAILLLHPACRFTTQPRPDKFQILRITMVQAALPKKPRKAICLAVDPTIVTLGDNGAGLKKSPWLLNDPDSALLGMLNRPDVIPASQCPKGMSDGEVYQIQVGPLLVYKSARVEGEVSYGVGGYPTLESCVIDPRQEPWSVACTVLSQA